jgi:hypothetical protein
MLTPNKIDSDAYQNPRKFKLEPLKLQRINLNPEPRKIIMDLGSNSIISINTNSVQDQQSHSSVRG